MLNAIFDKTDKGRDEIATRRFQLPLRMRSLLVLVDGRHSGKELLGKVSGLGLDSDSLAELLREGYVCVIDSALPDSPSAVVDTGAGYATLGIAESTPNPERRLQLIRDFYIDTIKNHIGLRGFPLQIKVEKAHTLDELRALRAAYLEGIFIAKGEGLARTLRDQLDELLNNG